MFKIDPEATERAGFKDPRSYVGMPPPSGRFHPGTDHACVYLFGKEDVGARRDEIRKKNEGLCEYCGRLCWWSGELHHRVGGNGAQRCWCYENLAWVCKECHFREQGRIIGGRR